MKKIEIIYALHRQQRKIFLRFETDRELNAILKEFPGGRWSRTKKCWHIPSSKSLLDDFIKLLPAGWKLVHNEFSSPDTHFQIEPKEVVKIKSQLPDKEKSPELPVNKVGLVKLSVENAEAMKEFVSQLTLKAYSESTIRTYKNEFGALLQTIRSRPVHSLTADEVKRYILYCIHTLNLSENTIHSRLNALKFYFEQVLKRDKIFVEIPRPKKKIILPKVLGEQEINKLFRSLENKKHKAILFTAYSAGLRVSEAVSLKISDIDSDRMQIFIRNAKGKKDRYVMLSPVLLDILRNYLRTWKPRPREYLFEGMDAGEPMSMRSAQEVFLQAKRRAGLRKEVSFHSLRHSFATHLLEQGIDIKYIKELLGHFSIHTTNRYLHVKRENLINIRSPLDEIYQTGDWDF